MITGDSGGGAAVHHLIKSLKRIDVMDEAGKMLACDMHNFVKPLEVACSDCWGRQGIGHRSPFQMIYLFVKIIKTVRKEFTRPGLERMWNAVIEKMRTDPLWKAIAERQFPGPFDDFNKKVDMENPQEGDDTTEASPENATANLQDPVFTRWGTVLAGVSVFANNWPVIYFFCVTVKDDKKSSSYLWQLCCALLSLMNNKDDLPPTNEGKSLEDFINSFSLADREDTPTTTTLQPGDTPTFLAVLYFLDGFNNAFFEGKYIIYIICCVFYLLYHICYHSSLLVSF